MVKSGIRLSDGKLSAKEYCFSQDVVWSKLRDPRELGKGYVPANKMGMRAQNSLHSTSSAQDQTRFAHDMLKKSGIKTAVVIMTRIMASRTQGHMPHSDPTFLHCSEGIRSQTGIVEKRETDSQRANERTLHVFEVKENSLISTRSLGT